MYLIKPGENLSQLGVNQVVNIMLLSESPEEISELINAPTNGKTLDKQDIDRLDQAKMMLKAHEELVDINENNINEFQNVLDYLRKKVEAVKIEFSIYFSTWSC